MMRLIDLSHTLSNEMPYYPADDAPTFHPVFTFAQNGVNMLRISFSTHIGTHLDCPSHMTDQALHTDNLSLETFYGSAVAVDCRPHMQDGLIMASVLDEVDPNADLDYLLFYTGHDQLWGDRNYFNTYPVFSEELTARLIALPIKGVGLDTISVDPVDSVSFTNHRRILGAQKIILENLTHLGTLLGMDFSFMALPLKIESGDGSPVRAVAITDL